MKGWLWNSFYHVICGQGFWNLSHGRTRFASSADSSDYVPVVLSGNLSTNYDNWIIRDILLCCIVIILRKHNMTGRPYGAEGFLKKLERRLERRVRALPVGRPKTKQINIK